MSTEAPVTESFWCEVDGEQLAQGDYLTNCPVPVFPSDYGTNQQDASVGVRIVDLIIVTQSCDLEQKKVSLVAMCPILTTKYLKEWGDKFTKPATLEEIRTGKHVALHMVSSTEKPEDNSDVRVVDFREIHSLPIEYLARHAKDMGKRWRLKSPYLEHFSQSFARFFMRVGLPSAIQKFK